MSKKVLINIWRVLMIKLKVSYENEVEKIKLLEALKKVKNVNVKSDSRKGNYYKMYIDIE